VNLDQYETSDLGACGEPYTVNLVCEGAFGSFAHGITGIGLAGARFPEDPWEASEGLEFGARLEFRWDRFSFAISDFYGYDDFPWIERITTYERNVDPATGRPRIIGSRGPCTTGAEPACLRPGPTESRTVSSDPDAPNDPASQVPNPAFTTTDPFGTIARDAAADPDGALLAHHANQQVFAVVCSTTIGILSIDPTACAQNALGSQQPQLGGAFVTSQVVSGLLMGGPLAQVGFATELGLDLGPYSVTLSKDPSDLPPPGDTSCLDRSFNPAGNPCGGAPAGGNQSAGFAFFGESLAQTLTPEQEALIGCGPFWLTNCDDSGLDLLNTETTALLQSFPGFEGTVIGWRTDVGDPDNGNPHEPQPGTVGYFGGPVCTASHLGGPQDPAVKLPGCRGPGDPGYDVNVDGDPTGLLHPFATDAGGNPQQFQNEMAGLSWNFLLVTISQDPGFDADQPTAAGRCSFLMPQLCENVQGLLRLSGITRPDIRAGGNGTFGRRAFQWHNGGEVVLRFEKRNVLGFAMDTAVDVLKANFSTELTWIHGLPRGSVDARDGIIRVDQYNLTISADRPTFINFLNANRTFFFNTQWFFQYIEDWDPGATGNGPWNVLATFSVSTGYHQDRLLPSLTLVYDFASVSGAALPQLTYRYNERFSVSVGAAIFMGRAELADMAINPIALQNRVQTDPDRYKNQEENGLSPVRDRDEVFLRLRYTF